MTPNHSLPAARGDLAWFFDVDGTVVEIEETPEAVVVSEPIRQLIDELHGRAHGAVALISGRSLHDIDLLFPGKRYPAAGQHGLERRDAHGQVRRLSERSPELFAAQVELADLASAHPGLHLEVKGISLALHYRLAPRLAPLVYRRMRALVERLGPRFHLQAGKRVVELLPVGADKGSAVAAFMEEPPFAGRVPVFIGDDVTDEHAFAIVNALSGYSVKVGPGPTLARCRLPDVTAVRGWLEGTRR